MRIKTTTTPPKHQKVHPKSSSGNPEDSDDKETINHADEHFVFQVGHKFILLYASWIRLEEGLFETSIDQHYILSERFENDQNKSQSQLKEIIDLLQVKFQPPALHQRWFRKQVRSHIHSTTIYILMSSL